MLFSFWMERHRRRVRRFSKTKLSKQWPSARHSRMDAYAAIESLWMGYVRGFYRVICRERECVRCVEELCNWNISFIFSPAFGNFSMNVAFTFLFWVSLFTPLTEHRAHYYTHSLTACVSDVWIAIMNSLWIVWIEITQSGQQYRNLHTLWLWGEATLAKITHAADINHIVRSVRLFDSVWILRHILALCRRRTSTCVFIVNKIVQ